MSAVAAWTVRRLAGHVNVSLGVHEQGNNETVETYQGTLLSAFSAGIMPSDVLQYMTRGRVG